MITATVLALAAVALFGPVGTLLARANWTTKAPRAGVVLWQSIGLSGALAAIASGLAVTVAPMRIGMFEGVLKLVRQAEAGHPLAGLGLCGALGLTMATDVGAVLVGGLTVTTVRTLRRRRYHRLVLDLVATSDAQLPGVAMLNDDRAAAYSIPGRRPRVVMSSGARRLLSGQEIGAVMAHEEGHLDGHHDLVLLPFASMAHLLRWMPYVRHARSQVGVLLEMAADDHAAQLHSPLALASALIRIATADAPPACSLSAATLAVPARVERLMEEERTSRLPAFAALTAACLVVTLPIAAILMPVAPV